MRSGSRWVRELSVFAAALAVVGCGSGDKQAAITETVGATRSSALTALPRTGWTGTASVWTSDAWKALDGSSTTTWSTEATATTGQWFQVDMLAPQVFAGLTLESSANEYARNFDVKVSNDGSSWTTVGTFSKSAAPVTVTFALQTARYVKVTLTAGFSSWWNITELKVLSPVLPRTGWIAMASANAASDTPDKALDATVGTRWSTSADQASGQFYQVDMLVSQSFNRITLDAGSSTGWYPRSFEVYVSGDGTNWGSAVATGAGTAQFITITFPFQWARYVKVVLTAASSGNVWAIHEFNVYGQATALSALSQAGWSATTSPIGTGAASNAFDGNQGGSTRWTSQANQANGQWFRLDLGTPRTFAQLTLDAAPSTDEYPRGYSVQVSNDGTNWGSAVATGTGASGLTTITFPSQTARYVRITQTGTSSSWWWSIYELNVYGLALARAGWVVTASAASGSDTVGKAFDNSTTSRWTTSANQTNGQYIQVDMVTPHAFNEIWLDAGTGTSAGRYPRSYEVRTSNDGATWGSPVATGAGTSGLTTIKFLTQTARYIKITQTGTASVPWSVYELNVWRGDQPCDTTTCTASDTCHDAGACNPYTGTCSSPQKANDTLCNDGNACTTGEKCTAGVCGSGAAVTCPGADQCNTVAACVPATGCPAPAPKANDTPCNDSNACTQSDKCQSGACVGTNPVTCTASDQCHTAGTCNTATGMCSNPTKRDGLLCNDGDANTQSERCQAGVCTPSTQFPTVTNVVVEDLGYRPGATSSIANDINDRGQAVGGSLRHMIFWDRPTNLIDVNASGNTDPTSVATAFGVNESGTMVGNVTWPDATSHAIRYSVANGYEDLGSLGDGTPSDDAAAPYKGSQAHAVNESAQFTGFYTSGGVAHGFRYTDGVGVEDIGSLAGHLTGGTDIDDAGRVFGYSWVPGTPTTNDPSRLGHAVMWENALVGLVDLNDLIDPLSGWVLYNASGAAGDWVVGTGLHDGEQHPYRLNLVTGVVDDVWPGVAGAAAAADVNTFGDVVGFSYLEPNFGSPRGFLYSDKLGAKLVNDFVDPAANWTITDANGINDSGDIVGKATHAGHTVAYRMSEIMSPQLACEGKADGARCSNGYTCQANNVCSGFVCGGGQPADAFCLRIDGVVSIGGGMLAAVMGYDNHAADIVLPTINEVRLDGVPALSPRPEPPDWLSTGSHVAAFFPIFAADQVISWRVNGQLVSSEGAPVLPTFRDADGDYIMLGGQRFPLPVGREITPRVDGVALEGGRYFAVFSYTSSASTNVHIPYGTDNFLAVGGVFVPTPAERPPEWFVPQGGKFVAELRGDSLTWGVGSERVTASREATLTVVTHPEGKGVLLGDDFVLLEPDPAAPLVGAIVPSAQPDVDHVVGETPSSFRVTNDGAAELVVPLWVPSGRADMQPELSIRYHSRASNGPLGVGVNLVGLSEIQRCARTIAQDGSSAALNLDGSRYCLDGARLILVQGTGGDGSVYRTEHDAFAKITKYDIGGSVDHFEVRYKNGRIAIFGGGDSTWYVSRSDTRPPQSGPRPTETVAYAWSIRQLRDRAGGDSMGNTIDYTYSDPMEGTGISSHRIEEIRYTGWGSSPGNRRVKFVWEDSDRLDSIGQYIDGAKVGSVRRLHAIEMRGPGLDDNSGTTPVVAERLLRSYELSYGTSYANERSLLRGIIECDGAGACKQPLYLDYDPGNKAFRPLSASTLGPSYVDYFSVQVSDLDGDGFGDLVFYGDNSSTCGNRRHPLYYCLGSGNSTAPFNACVESPDLGYVSDFCAQQQHPENLHQFTRAPEILDIDGDGVSDFALIDKDDHWTFVYNESVVLPDGRRGIRTRSSLAFGAFAPSGAKPRPYFVDLNGDTLPELVHRHDDGTGAVYLRVWKNTRQGFTFAGDEAVVLRNRGWPGSWINPPEDIPVLTGSVTGNGASSLLTEAFSLSDDNLLQYLRLDDDVTFVERTSIPAGVAPTSNWAGSWAHYRFVDINGDGQGDVLGFPSYLNTGAGFLELENLPSTTGIAIDMNDDGVMDLLHGVENVVVPTVAHTVSATISDRSGGQLTSSMKIQDADGQDIKAMFAYHGDVDGDGRVDLVTNPGTWGAPVAWTSYVRDGKKADQLTGIITPLGHQIDVEYQPTARAATRGWLPYPIHNAMSGVWVVSAIHEHDARQPTITVEYSYDAPGIDMLGRGWLGFASRTAVTKDAGGALISRSRAEFDQRSIGYAGGAGSRLIYPYLGLTAKVTDTVGIGGPLPVTNDRIRTNSFRLISGSLTPGSYYSVGYGTVTNLEQELLSGFGGFGVPPTVFRYQKDVLTYDPYGHGNVVTQIRQFEAGKAEDDWTGAIRTSSAYQNDEQRWLVGTLTSQTVEDASGDGSTLKKTASYVVDPAKNLVNQVTLQAGLTEQQLDIVYERDDHGLITDVTKTVPGEPSRHWSYGYDDDGIYQTSMTDPLGAVTSSVYHPGLGVPVRAVDANGLTTSRTYDGFARLRSQTEPSGSGMDVFYEVSQARFTGSSYQIRKVNRGGGAIVTTFDALDRATWMETTDRSAQESVVVMASYDPRHPGLVASVTQPTRLSALDATTPTTERTYDGLGRLTSETGPEGAASKVSVTYYARQVNELLANGHERQIVTDGRRRVREIRERMPADDFGSARDIVTSYTLGGFGTVRFIDNGTSAPNGTPTGVTRTSLTYDDLTRRTQIVDPDTGTTAAHYNGFGELKEVTDANGDTITRSYDALSRLTKVADRDGETGFVWDLAAHGIGKAATTSSPTGISETFAYDPSGRLSAETWKVGGLGELTLGHGYDEFGRENQTTYPAVAGREPLKIGRIFDEDGVVRLISHGYDVLWEAVHRDVYGAVDVEHNAAGVRTSRTKDPTSGMTTQIKAESDGGQLLKQLDYSYYPWRDVATRTVDGFTESFCYDALGRLAGWAHVNSSVGGPGVGYRYDDRGNMVRRADGYVQNTPGDGTCAMTTVDSEAVYVPGTTAVGPHRLDYSPDGAYGYDGKGNQTTAPGRTVIFTAFDLPGAITTGAGTTSFGYDAHQRRVVKESPDGTKVVSIGDLYERRIAGAQTTHVFHLKGSTDTPVAQIVWTEAGGVVTNETTSYIYRDLLDSVAASGASGSLASRSYDPFGRAAETGEAAVSAGFAGHEDDRELGLVNMRGRVYEPRTARFLTPDPFIKDAFDSQQLNRYAYVGNNPVSYLDPSGFLRQGQSPWEDVGSLDGASFGNGTLTVTLGSGQETSVSFDINAGPTASLALKGDSNDSYVVLTSGTGNVSTASGPRYETIVTAPKPTAPPAAATTVSIPWQWLGAGAGAGAGGGTWAMFIRQVLRRTPVGIFIAITLTPSKIGEEGPMYPPPAYPGDDPAKPPGEGWEWKGKGAPGSPEGNWVRPNPGGGRPESLHPDLDHAPPIGPHWDWKDPSGKDWRIFPDGTIKPK